MKFDEPARILGETHHFGNIRGYSPAAQCRGWTCPQCGHHWISVTGFFGSCSLCGFKRQGETPEMTNRRLKRSRELRRGRQEIANESSGVPASVSSGAAESALPASRRISSS